jgi:hypothetical protein
MSSEKTPRPGTVPGVGTDINVNIDIDKLTCALERAADEGRVADELVATWLRRLLRQGDGARGRAGANDTNNDQGENKAG